MSDDAVTTQYYESQSLSWAKATPRGSPCLKPPSFSSWYSDSTWASQVRRPPHARSSGGRQSPAADADRPGLVQAPLSGRERLS